MYERWIPAQPPQVFIILRGEMGWEGVGPGEKLGVRRGWMGCGLGVVKNNAARG